MAIPELPRSRAIVIALSLILNSERLKVRECQI